MSKEKDESQPMPEVPKGYEGLRDALFDELNGVRTGSVSLEHGRVVGMIAKRIIDLATVGLYAQQQLPEKNFKQLLGVKDNEQENG